MKLAGIEISIVNVETGDSYEEYKVKKESDRIQCFVASKAGEKFKIIGKHDDELPQIPYCVYFMVNGTQVNGGYLGEIDGVAIRQTCREGWQIDAHH